MSANNRHFALFGCGFLGREVASQAADRGFRLTALTRNSEDAERLRKSEIPAVVSELRSSSWHEKIDLNPDAALIAVNSGKGGPDGYRKSWIEGLQSVLDWSRSHGRIENLIFISSTSVYPQNSGEWISEEDPASGSSEAAKVLIEAEKILQNSKEVGRAFVLRLGGIYGPGRHHLLNRAFSGEFSEEEGDEIFLNSIHVKDAAAAVIAAAESEISGGIFNIVDDLPTPRGEIVRYLCEQIRARNLSFSKESKTVRRRRRAGVRPNRQISNRKAKEILGWQPEFPDFRTGYASLLSERG